MEVIDSFAQHDTIYADKLVINVNYGLQNIYI